MERASQSERLWAYAITRDEYAKRLSEKSLLKIGDLEYIRNRTFNLLIYGFKSAQLVDMVYTIQDRIYKLFKLK